MNSLQTYGEQAAVIARHWWLLFGLGAAVFVAVCIAGALALHHARRRTDAAMSNDAQDARERRATRIIAVSTGVTVAILLVVFADSLYASRNNDRLKDASSQTIEIEGLQWWWRIRYLDSIPARTVETANELHLPVGRVVKLRLISNDVIHSFWVPQLHGKLDLVPGRTNELGIRATHVGTFRGVCAEFCGMQHARMHFIVVVHEPDDYDRWLAEQRLPAVVTADPALMEGQRIFETRDCGTCHRVRGTAALGRVGPDLTHFGSRLTIAAGAAPNTRGHLAGWIADPQSMKPGSRMPRVTLTATELKALLDWVESLQ